MKWDVFVEGPVHVIIGGHSRGPDRQERNTLVRERELVLHNYGSRAGGGNE